MALNQERARRLLFDLTGGNSQWDLDGALPKNEGSASIIHEPKLRSVQHTARPCGTHVVNHMETNMLQIAHRKASLLVFHAHVSSSQPHRLNGFVERDAINVLARHGELSGGHSLHG